MWCGAVRSGAGAVLVRCSAVLVRCKREVHSMARGGAGQGGVEGSCLGANSTRRQWGRSSYRGGYRT